jgi:putative glutamine amidotransferase
MTPSERPRILVAACFMYPDPERAVFRTKTLQYTEQGTARSVWRAGGLPVPSVQIPDDPEASIAAILELCDGVVLQGGTDVAPGSYGEDPEDPRWHGDPHRDEYERRVIAAARAAGKPIFAICRGMQILNVALGGTLIQDIPTHVDSELPHRDKALYDGATHDVRVAPGSELAGAYEGAASLEVNSVHHQCVKRLADELTPVAWAEDGIVEAAERVDDRDWILAVQWHPEWLDGEWELEQSRARRSDGLALFRRFVTACRARAEKR